MENVFYTKNSSVLSDSGLPLAMAYVVPQEWDEIYDTGNAFCRGTIFPCLDKPFLGHEVRNGRK